MDLRTKRYPRLIVQGRHHRLEEDGAVGPLVRPGGGRRPGVLVLYAALPTGQELLAACWIMLKELPR